MKEYDLQDLQKEFDSLPDDKLEALAKNEMNATASDVIWESNVYLTPRIIAMYWRPALNGSEVKILDYIIYKTIGFGKDKTLFPGATNDGDAIAQDQLLDGTTTTYKDETTGKKKTIRWDYGCGVKNKKTMNDGIKVLEFLNLIEVVRKYNEEEKRHETNFFRLKVHREYEKLNTTQRQGLMLEDPFLRVAKVRAFLKEKGIIST